MTKSDGTLIWITGYSSSGKTSIGKLVTRYLLDYTDKVIFLDGDELRKILGGTYGYSRSERINLAHVYFRLCQNLIEQGFIVVISCVALFNDISKWIRKNINRTHIIYIECPLVDRNIRDSLTKNIRSSNLSVDDGYDLVKDFDLIITNSNIQSVETVSAEIFDYIFQKINFAKDYNRTAHWSNFYKMNFFSNPSTFSKFVMGNEPSSINIIDIGCGDGRDSEFFLLNNSNNVLGIDRSLDAIRQCESRNLKGKIAFRNIEAKQLEQSYNDFFDVAYCRFVLHAMPIDEELSTLHHVNRILKKGGRFYIECRSINDPLYELGTAISKTEKIYGHYRRFIILHELVVRLESRGFEVTYKTESNNLSVSADDNPILIRLIGIKK